MAAGLGYALTVSKPRRPVGVADLPHLIAAGVRCFSIASDEEARAIEAIEDAMEGTDREVHVWSGASGVDRSGRATSLAELLPELRRAAPRDLWVLTDATTWLRDPALARAFRELSSQPGDAVFIFLHAAAAPDVPFPECLAIALPRPTAAQIHEAATRAGIFERASASARWLDANAARGLAVACVGLGVRQALHMLRFALTRAHGSLEAALDTLRGLKTHHLAGDSLLETVETIPPGEIGGLDNLKSWVQSRALALHPEARAAGIPTPKGLLVVGVQGCGKSLAARACGALLGLDVVRLDVGRLFTSALGGSEAQLQETLALVERLAPVVLWIDEIDKSLSHGRAGASDGGTADRVMATLLTWLQDRTAPVFLAATANAIERLPPELVRRGRLDETFFVGLPDADTRARILRVHLCEVPRRMLDAVPPLADPVSNFEALARDAEGFSGAELEAALVEARLRAFSRGEPLSAEDLATALRATVPLSTSHTEQLAALERWATHRARRA